MHFWSKSTYFLTWEGWNRIDSIGKHQNYCYRFFKLKKELKNYIILENEICQKNNHIQWLLTERKLRVNTKKSNQCSLLDVSGDAIDRMCARNLGTRVEERLVIKPGLTPSQRVWRLRICLTNCFDLVFLIFIFFNLSELE